MLNFQNADIEPSKTCWTELRDESEEELTLLLGADFPDSEYPRSRVDQSAIKLINMFTTQEEGKAWPKRSAL